MENTNTINFIKGLSVGLFLLGGILITQDKGEKHRQESLELPPPPDNDYSKVKSWDYQENHWETYEPFVPTKRQWSNNYSDEEIRMLREKQSFKNDGSYIHTPGRYVPTRKELDEKAIEDYIDEHGQELYDELEDKYGD